jgi:hypothetical protein
MIFFLPDQSISITKIKGFSKSGGVNSDKMRANIVNYQA